MKRIEQPTDPEWACSWEETRKRQLSSAMAATPAQRLAWLEEAIALAHQSGALPRKRHDAWTSTKTGDR